MLSCIECGRTFDKADIITCKSCTSKKVQDKDIIRDRLCAEVAELKDAVQLAILDDPVKMVVLRENSQKLNVNANELHRQHEEERFEHEKILNEHKIKEEEDMAAFAAENEAKIVDKKAILESLIEQETMKKTILVSELKVVTKTVAEQRHQLLENVKKCFKISLTRINNIDHLQILHFQLPLDGNYNRMAPDDLNAVLGHIAQITVHMSKIFALSLPFDMVSNMPITYIRLGPDHIDRILLWMNSQDTTGSTVGKFVTAVALMNFCITWLASAVLPEEQTNSWNGMRNFWAIIDGWTSDMPLHRPSASLPQVMRETMYSWNLHTGDNVSPSISLDRLTSIMRLNCLETVIKHS